ncbi:enolase C-terminal domain-like protein [Burkholderia sp. 22PA0106]|uniref:enolase C-terminal domain-like protein n=1 Tax=Burkholderia sp. 22PA0106 TaxID=3237371 RepID=UPI0039C02027
MTPSLRTTTVCNIAGNAPAGNRKTATSARPSSRNVIFNSQGLVIVRVRDADGAVGKGDLRKDVERAYAIKHALGDRARVHVDANQCWDESAATWGIERLEDAGIAVVEQSLARFNVDGMRRLCERFTIPIMAAVTNAQLKWEKTMPYVIETWDRPNSFPLRLEARPEHLDYLAKHASFLLACGAKLNDDGKDLGGGMKTIGQPPNLRDKPNVQ